MFGEETGIRITTTQSLQMLLCFIPPFGCFRTALTLAASAGETDVIELLLSYGANIACDTAVDYALRSGHSE